LVSHKQNLGTKFSGHENNSLPRNRGSKGTQKGKHKKIQVGEIKKLVKTKKRT
jgi:hypothetical protein